MQGLAYSLRRAPHPPTLPPPSVPQHTCASERRLRFSSTSLLAIGKLRSIDSKALRVMTITLTVLRDLQG